MRRGNAAAAALVERYRALCAAGRAARDAEREAFAGLCASTAELETLYDAFLRQAKPEAVRQHGIYATPRPVVQAQVRLVDELLRTRLGCARGIADERVVVADPAVGVGAYPLAVLEHVGAAWADGVRDRMLLLEAMPGAAAVANARGLPVLECDALSADLKLDAPVVVCIGNPPYRRRPSDASTRAMLDGFIADAGGVHRKNLFNDYVYFWRWALRLAFEQRAGPGVVCFVTAGSYLHGPAFGGLRQTLRRLADELWVLDLEGDYLAARATENVFPIRTPVAIALAVRTGARVSEPTTVQYARLTGTRDSKLAALNRVRQLADLDWTCVSSTGSAPLRPSHASDYSNWPALTELFPWQLSGAQLKRTWPIGVTPDVLRARWQRLLAILPEQRAEAFGVTRDRTVFSTPPDLRDRSQRLTQLAELPSDAACPEPVRYAYRAFDRQWVLPDARLGDYLRPALWRVSGPRQVFLSTMLTNVLGPGPAAVATALVPDLDHFRGSFGARGVIPLWGDADATQANVSEAWLVRLSEHYGFEVTAAALMAYCYTLLSAPSYTRQFAEELRMPGPHLPMAHDGQTFTRASTLGAWLIERHTYRAVDQGAARTVAEVGDIWPTRFQYAAERIGFGDGWVGPVPRELWNYRVSGYPVLAGWLRQRIASRHTKSVLDAIRPTRWTPELTRELLELVWLLEATFAVQPRLDSLLYEVVSGGYL